MWLSLIPDNDTGAMAPISFEVQKAGAVGTHPSATAYVWYDWDGNGQVGLGAYPDSGEIETVSLGTDNRITTGEFYPVGASVWFQLHAASYQVIEVSRKVPAPVIGWDGTTALSVSAVQMVLLDTAITVTASAVGTLGTVTIDTSTDYNSTLNGVNPTITFRITCGTDDAGIGQPSYRDWSTGLSYHGSFFAFDVALTDKSDFTVGGTAFDYIGDDGTNAWYVWDIPNIFNDAGITTDGYAEITVSFTGISGAFEVLLANVYDGVLATSFSQFSFGTADGSETSLNFLAPA
jgi:hypothetical protein